MKRRARVCAFCQVWFVLFGLLLMLIFFPRETFGFKILFFFLPSHSKHSVLRDFSVSMNSMKHPPMSPLISSCSASAFIQSQVQQAFKWVSSIETFFVFLFHPCTTHTVWYCKDMYHDQRREARFTLRYPTPLFNYIVGPSTWPSDSSDCYGYFFQVLTSSAKEVVFLYPLVCRTQAKKKTIKVCQGSRIFFSLSLKFWDWTFLQLFQGIKHGSCWKKRVSYLVPLDWA